MYLTVDLNRQPCTRAVKIENVGAKRVLATKLHSIKLPTAQHAPHHFLRRGAARPQSAGHLQSLTVRHVTLYRHPRSRTPIDSQTTNSLSNSPSSRSPARLERGLGGESRPFTNLKQTRPPDRSPDSASCRRKPCRRTLPRRRQCRGRDRSGDRRSRRGRRRAA